MLAIFFLLLISAVFGKNIRESGRSKKCALQLASALFTPDTCGVKYLRRISHELQVKSPLLFNVQNYTVLQEFARTYGVAVLLVDAFGHIATTTGQTIDSGFTKIYGPIDPTFAPLYLSFYNHLNTVGLPVSAFGAVQARVVVTGEAGMSGALNVFAFIVWSPSGEMYTVYIINDRINDPLFC